MMKTTLPVVACIMFVIAVPGTAAAQDTNTDRLISIQGMVDAIQTATTQILETLTAIGGALAGLADTQNDITTAVSDLGDAQANITTRLDVMARDDGANATRGMGADITALASNVTTLNAKQANMSDQLSGIRGDLALIRAQLDDMAKLIPFVEPAQPEPYYNALYVFSLPPPGSEHDDRVKFSMFGRFDCTQPTVLFDMNVQNTYSHDDFNLEWEITTGPVTDDSRTFLDAFGETVYLGPTTVAAGTYDTKNGLVVSEGVFPTAPMTEFRVSGEGLGHALVTWNHVTMGKCLGFDY